MWTIRLWTQKGIAVGGKSYPNDRWGLTAEKGAQPLLSRLVTRIGAQRFLASLEQCCSEREFCLSPIEAEDILLYIN